MVTTSERAAAKAAARHRSKSPKARKSRSKSPKARKARKARSKSPKARSKSPKARKARKARSKSPKSRKARSKSPKSRKPAKPRPTLEKPRFETETVSSYLRRHKFRANLSTLPRQWTALEIWTCFSALPKRLQNRRTFATYLKEFVLEPTVESMAVELLGSNFRSFVERREQNAVTQLHMKVAASKNEAHQRTAEAVQTLKNIVKTPSMTAAAKAKVKTLARQETALQHTVQRLDQLSQKAATSDLTAKQNADLKRRIEAQQQKLAQQESRLHKIKAVMGLTLAALGTYWSYKSGLHHGARWGSGEQQGEQEGEQVPGQLALPVPGQLALPVPGQEGGPSATPWYDAWMPGWSALGGGGMRRQESKFERAYHRHVQQTRDPAGSVQMAMDELGF